ncbi:MAG: hypothetical protein LBG27_00695 [Spirochaetaceae bacterium]|jgi:hypothetical protein|nr:hypothetical protein [Spirochaetaceae bacterium]
MGSHSVKTAQNLILIGSTGRNAGKTTLAAALIKKLCEQRLINAAKIITVERKGALCPHGGKGCGACSLERDFVLCEEHACLTSKDTAGLLMAGANRVFLLRSLKQALLSAFTELRRQAGNQTLIAESNSLRTVVKPAFFVMLTNGNIQPKPSAQAVMEAADLIVSAPFTENDLVRILAHILARLSFPKQKDIQPLAALRPTGTPPH